MAELTDSSSLTVKQHNLIAALLIEASVRKACEVTGVKERTAYHWLKQECFRREYMLARRESVAQAVARTQQASSAAVGVLVRLMANARSEAVKLGAATKILDIAIKSVELDDLAARLAALEQRYATQL